ncbi:MAG: isopentenyl phosphate kinase [Patescibacteria group bacterium]
MKDLVLVKLGGSVITDKSKPYTARVDTIQKLAKKIKGFKNKNTDLIIGHGSGSFAHIPAAKYQTQKGLINKDSVWGLALTADAAIQINRIVITEFIKLKIPIISFAPLSFNYGNKILVDHIQKALDLGIIPVIYGDVIMNKKQGFEIYSGEKTLDILATKLSKNYKRIKIIYYTDTNGVYDNSGKTISLITPKNFKEIKKYLQGSENTDVTGGMIHKVEESLKLVQKLDAKVYITSGFELKNKGTKITKI